jgi:uncharacterized protein
MTCSPTLGSRSVGSRDRGRWRPCGATERGSRWSRSDGPSPARTSACSTTTRRDGAPRQQHVTAAIVADHVHHDAAEALLAGGTIPFATCSETEGSLVRLHLREGACSASVTAVITAVGEHPRHEFWEDDLSYRAVDLCGVVGHRQATDAYLAMLARKRGGRLRRSTRDWSPCTVTWPISCRVGRQRRGRRRMQPCRGSSSSRRVRHPTEEVSRWPSCRW